MRAKVLIWPLPTTDERDDDVSLRSSYEMLNLHRRLQFGNGKIRRKVKKAGTKFWFFRFDSSDKYLDPMVAIYGHP